MSLFFCAMATVTAFTLPPNPQHSISLPTISSSSPLLLFAFYNDFDELGDNDDIISDSTDDSDLYTALRKRQSSLDNSRQRNMEAWKVPPVETMLFPLLNDWVRRVAMDTTAVGVTATSSYAIVGGASGTLYLIDLSAETNNPEQVKEDMILGTLENLHEERGEEDFPGASSSARTRAIETLYGGFDGGGIIALAMRDGIVASAGREGGVHISRIQDSADKNQLKAMGKIPELKSFVTSLSFDQTGQLWVGSFDDGMIRAYDVDDESSAGSSLVEQSEPAFTLKADSGIVSLFLADEIGCGVAATERNGIVLFSTTNGTMLAKWDPFSDSDEFARSVVIVQNDEDPGAPPMTIPDPEDPTKEATLVSVPIWSVVVGGSSGSLHQRRLNINPQQGNVSSKRPFDDLSFIQKLREQDQHAGPIVALASPGPQVLLSASQDGTIRVWDCSHQQSLDTDDADMQYDGDADMRDYAMGGREPKFLFAMSGFKVWLGSMIVLRSNQNMLVCDGADNTVVALLFKSAE